MTEEFVHITEHLIDEIKDHGQTIAERNVLAGRLGNLEMARRKLEADLKSIPRSLQDGRDRALGALRDLIAAANAVREPFASTPDQSKEFLEAITKATHIADEIDPIQF